MAASTCNILITGASGQIGRELSALAADLPGAYVAAYDRSALDIANPADVRRVFAERQWHFCFNCAAYTAVDRAESEPGLAAAVNRDGAGLIAEACAGHGARLVHFSTDYVYHNALNRPLLETDPVAPQSVYARTKLEGETAVLERLPDALVLRASWVYSSFGHNFVKTMRRLGRERDALTVVFDQIGTPTYARDIAGACLQIIRQTQTTPDFWRGGVFNFSNEGVCSWYDFALAIFELSGIDCRVSPIESKDFPTPALRPPYSVLNKTKFKSVFHLTIPHWREALARCLAEIAP